MITRKTHFVSPTAKIWTLTPDISPQLSPVVSDCDADDEANMSIEDLSSTRPIRIASPSPEAATSSSRPTLEDILNERSQPPYTLSAFTAYLSQKHCLETLEFTIAAKQYQDKYAGTAAHLAGMPMNCYHHDVRDLQRDWIRILDVYIKPGSPREINLPAEERDDLLDQTYSDKPPEPEALDPALNRIHDLMGESIFMPFLNSFNPASRAKTFSTPGSDFGGRREVRPDLSTSLVDDGEDLLNRMPSRRHRSPPSSSGIDFSAPKSPPISTSHTRTQSSSITSAMARSSGHGPSTYVSNFSAASGVDGALSDDSGSVESPGGLDPMTPPTTPPSSDIPTRSLHNDYNSKPNRVDSGSWKSMTKKFWGKKKNGGTLQERPDEE